MFKIILWNAKKQMLKGKFPEVTKLVEDFDVLAIIESKIESTYSFSVQGI